jgi:hypothetical protein
MIILFSTLAETGSSSTPFNMFKDALRRAQTDSWKCDDPACPFYQSFPSDTFLNHIWNEMPFTIFPLVFIETAYGINLQFYIITDDYLYMCRLRLM